MVAGPRPLGQLNIDSEISVPQFPMPCSPFLPDSEVTVSEVAQSCPTLCDPMDCGLSGSSVHVIFQARVLEWIAISSPGDLPNPGIKLGSPTLQADALPSEPPGKSFDL